MTAEEIANALPDGYNIVPVREQVGTYFNVVCVRCGKVIYSFDECCGEIQKCRAVILALKHNLNCPQH